ncbi:hypothetical protein VHEMI06203 [[Torrubiella] hemipterigena]|uniref:Metallo-beta-lactamase domain-containing protein n=1 Tax=[Torrubiella] hemipterigena TaxID=1531966 RepID=A0A0A1TII2_9HYPO|nr:hypothetical protein VHEMI06203 [[Torrubiella] hemipterigena]
MLDIPHSRETVKLSLMDTGAVRTETASSLFKPHVRGFDTVTFKLWAFLISHGDTHVLFDLSNSDAHPEPVFHIDVTQDVFDVLDAATPPTIKPDTVSACIWSHHHFDHRGDIGRFPASTQLVVGPGVHQAYLPGYPSNPESELAETDFMGREVREMSNAEFTLTCGGYAAHDYFGDGSFFLLSSPGHTTGHLSALARVTSDSEDSTFVFLGGDCAHHCGVFRPSQYVPLPESITLGNVTYTVEEVRSIHPKGSMVEPFLQVDEEPMCEDHAAAVESVEKMQVFDAQDNILVCIAHDATLRRHLPVFPETLNGWKQADLKNKLRWEFLRDFGIIGG